MAIVQSAVLKFERQRNEVKRKPDFKIQAYEKGKRTFQWTSALLTLSQWESEKLNVIKSFHKIS